MCEGLLCVHRAVPPAAVPPAPAQLRSDGINLIVPMGVILGCVTMAGVVLMLWLVHHRMDRGAAAPAAEATGDEGARRCSLESDSGAPHLPKLPVIIVLPDNKTYSFGWQLEHTPCASPTAALCAEEGSCSSRRSALEAGKQAASGGNSPRSTAASSASSP